MCELRYIITIELFLRKNIGKLFVRSSGLLYLFETLQYVYLTLEVRIVVSFLIVYLVLSFRSVTHRKAFWFLVMKNIFHRILNGNRVLLKYDITFYINSTIGLNTFARKSQKCVCNTLQGTSREFFARVSGRIFPHDFAWYPLFDRSWQRGKHMSSYIRIDHVPARRGWSAERARVVRVIYYYVVVVVVVSALAISRQVQFLPFFYPAAVTF